MKTKTSLLFFTLVTTMGLSGPAVAKKFEAPEKLVCSTAFDNSFDSHWNVVEGATHYAIDLTADYDVNDDGEMDRSYGFHFGTPDPALALEEEDLMGKFVDDKGYTVEKKAKGAKMRVKAMKVAKGHEKGLGHYKAKGKGHHKDHGNKKSEFAECQVTFSEPSPVPDPDPEPCPYFRC